MRVFLFVGIFLVLVGLSAAQTVFLSDDFEDGDIAGWVNSDSAGYAASDVAAISGTYSLKHNAVGGGRNDIRIPFTNLKPDSELTVWRFNLKNGNWDPDITTKFWVYLMVHDTTSVDGYAVGVNLSGITDTLSLWKLTGSSEDGLIVSSSFDWGRSNLVGIEVTRDSLGLWELKYDSNGGFDNLVSAGAGFNDDYIAANYFGLSYFYKSAEAGELWLDDVLVQQGQRVNANIAAVLEGPFAADTMATALRAGGYMPLSQPFDASPWNYNGDETVLSIPDDVVDWVLVQLRTATDSASTVATRAAFVRKDGAVVDMDGVSTVSFSGLAAGDYYGVIRHRNHLAVMTATPQTMDDDNAVYDFSSAVEQAYGTGAMTEVATGVYGLITGDANGNSQVQNDDKNDDWATNAGTAGYKGADFDLNGQVQNSDKNEFWSDNVGLGTQVPF